MTAINELEQQVLRVAISDPTDILYELREQAKNIEVTNRTYTGVGFNVEFALPAGVPRLPGRPTFKLGDVLGTPNNVKQGLGFLLYLENGALAALEAYTYDEPWPEQIRELKLTYADGPNRNIAKLERVVAAAKSSTNYRS